VPPKPRQEPVTSTPARAPASASSSGSDLARAVLDAAKSKRMAAPRKTGRTVGNRKRGYSGPGPDSRDPQPFATVLAALMKARGWQRPAAEARLFGMWDQVVGADVAAHCRPVSLTDGDLVVEAESTAWATQLNLMNRKLLGRITDGVGRGVVTKLTVRGPLAPSWAKGPKRVRGRGPRDTYG